MTFPMDDAGVMALFSGTDILGVIQEQIGTPTGMLLLYGAWLMRPIRRPLRSSYSYLVSHGTDVLAGQCSKTIKQGICGPVHRYRLSGRHHGCLITGLNRRWPLRLWSACGRDSGWRFLKKAVMYIAAMKENNVPRMVHPEVITCSPKAHAAAYVMMACGYLLQVSSRFITVPTSPIRAGIW